MRFLMLPGLVLSGAIFGFFYAWACSAMWGLDTVAPDVAIRAMQAINGVVRNAVFAPAFFGTGPVLLLTAALVWRYGRHRMAALLTLAAAVYLLGAMLPTMLVNVPMNEALALVDPDRADAAQIWADYSGPWQAWNLARTVASGIALALVGLALMAAHTQTNGDATPPSAR